MLTRADKRAARGSDRWSRHPLSRRVARGIEGMGRWRLAHGRGWWMPRWVPMARTCCRRGVQQLAELGQAASKIVLVGLASCQSGAGTAMVGGRSGADADWATRFKISTRTVNRREEPTGEWVGGLLGCGRCEIPAARHARIGQGPGGAWPMRLRKNPVTSGTSERVASLVGGPVVAYTGRVDSGSSQVNWSGM
jgi:hypothetical protein